MTSSAALSGAAVRTLRTAAGRRALQVALLVGGVLVIGLLCGDRAFAADGVRAYAAEGVRASADSTAGRSVSGQRLLVRPDADASAARGQSPTHASAVRDQSHTRAPAARKRPSGAAPADRVGRTDEPFLSGAGSAQLVRGVGERAVRVADDTRESVSRELVKAQASLPTPSKAPSLPDVPALPVPPKVPTLPVPPKAPSAPALPDLPILPDAPAMPDLPGLPGPPAPPDGDVAVPGAPALPGAPGYPAFPSHPLPAPVTVDPQPGGATAPADTPASPGRTGVAGPVAHGMHGVHGDQYRAIQADRAGHGDAEHDRAHHIRRAAHAGPSASVGGADPVGHVPGGRPDGTLCNRSMADNGTPRHGDAHAVTLSSRAPLSLVRGVAARTCVAGTRDSHRDIPVLPG
ncbi:hypothetical protein GCM10010313_35560 [Streptomyces violarus]|uniref:Uncharacterized protein n=1 Tax=Streptomyces violarus TaxID=67380 RepID=A0A7W4ZPH5_9ACTN|nr:MULTISPECIES: hypothetical protein [Streptomyces]MBB3076271.1 hypothetical protein [Streptomyces violarus]WRT99085.1 hypothetical protein VJ737_15915 [Streptomyces sp. CGMCC 4.1772]GHD11907.1 hypothetical protein GCM10010313_35560 [Streptomyces violarus]